MSYVRIVVVFTALLFLFGCDESEEQVVVPQTVFTLTVDETFNTANQDDWFMIHDIEGNLIDYRAFETGDVITVESDKIIADEKINVTFVSQSTYPGSSLFLSSYLDVQKGSSWTQRRFVTEFVPTSNKIGDCTIVVNDPEPKFIGAASDKYGRSGFHEIVNGDFNISLSFWDTSGDILLYLTDGAGNPRYKFIKDIHDKDVIDISYNDMTPFESLVNVAFPKPSRYFYLVMGFEDDQDIGDRGYWTNTNLASQYSGNDMSLKLGYTDKLSKYYTIVSLVYSDYEYSYLKKGSAPTAIEFPFSATFEHVNKDLNGFEYSSGQNFIRRKSTWDFITASKHINWIVNASPTATQKFVDLPAELAAKYPDLKFDNFTLTSSEFTTKGVSYYNMLEETFKGKATTGLENYSVILRK